MAKFVWNKTRGTIRKKQKPKYKCIVRKKDWRFRSQEVLFLKWHILDGYTKYTYRGFTFYRSSELSNSVIFHRLKFFAIIGGSILLTYDYIDNYVEREKDGK